MSKTRSGPERQELHCSFCGKSRNQVEKLIAGPDVFICQECVELCNEIIDQNNRISMEDTLREGVEGKLTDCLRPLVAELEEKLAGCLLPLVAEAVARLTCPHCGKRLDEPPSPPPLPSQVPLQAI